MAIFFGTTGTDNQLVGTSAADLIYGLSGDGRLRGHQDDDGLYDGSGEDAVFWGDSGSDSLFGGYGDDLAFYGGSGDNRLFGGEEDDSFPVSGPGQRPSTAKKATARSSSEVPETTGFSAIAAETFASTVPTARTLSSGQPETTRR